MQTTIYSAVADVGAACTRTATRWLFQTTSRVGARDLPASASRGLCGAAAPADLFGGRLHGYLLLAGRRVGAVHHGAPRLTKRPW